MARDLNIMKGGETNIYPPRYFLDIVSQKEMMESIGVEQLFVIVLRDENIAKKARFGHCRNKERVLKEDKIGTDIIIQAIEKYILMNNNNNNNNTLTSDGRYRGLTSTLSSGNGIVLVSYESLMKLDQTYIRLLYTALGIESDYMPQVRDGNKKYVDSNFTKEHLHRERRFEKRWARGNAFGKQFRKPYNRFNAKVINIK